MGTACFVSAVTCQAAQDVNSLLCLSLDLIACFPHSTLEREACFLLLCVNTTVPVVSTQVAPGITRMASKYILLAVLTCQESGASCSPPSHCSLECCQGPEQLMWLFSFYHQFLICGFTQSLLLSDAGSVLATATNWDELEIQEETESGNSVTSKIRLPTQVSLSHCHRYLGCRREQSAQGKKITVGKPFPYIPSEQQQSAQQLGAWL